MRQLLQGRNPTLTARPRNQCSALVVVPVGQNYFYPLHGRRIAECLRELGCSVDVCPLSACPERHYDWCILVNISEVVQSFGNEPAALARVRRLAGRCRATASASLDCVSTDWYQRIHDYCDRTGIKTIVDFGLHDQSPSLPVKLRQSYHYVPNGLTASEARAVRSGAEEPERTIPWAVIAHVTPWRATIVDRLVRQVDPRGFVYLPQLAPIKETGSPHLNQAQFEKVLRQTRYQVWCSHHPHFYMESERFRTSLLCGSVPIKVIEDGQEIPEGAPFDYLIVKEEELSRRLWSFDFHALRSRFREDYLRLPGLTSGLSSFLTAAGVMVEPPRHKPEAQAKVNL
jgi:hypothetical protein